MTSDLLVWNGIPPFGEERSRASGPHTANFPEKDVRPITVSWVLFKLDTYSQNKILTLGGWGYILEASCQESKQFKLRYHFPTTLLKSLARSWTNMAAAETVFHLLVNLVPRNVCLLVHECKMHHLAVQSVCLDRCEK